MDIPNSKQQQLTFDKGITNVPSDAICSDNTLEECMGLYHDGAEHRPIQNPVLFMENLAGEVIFVHKLAGEAHYIYKTPLVYEQMRYHFTLSWRLKDDATAHEIATLNIDSQDTFKDIQVTAIGKTLIVNVPGEEIKYCLWKRDEQQYITFDRIPIANVKFRMIDPSQKIDPHTGSPGRFYRNVVWGTSKIDPSWFALHDYGRRDLVLADLHQEDYNNAAVGAYSQALKRIEEANGFALPFFIRYAIELYDGSYVNISAPILMFPAISTNAVGHAIDGAEEGSFEVLRIAVSYCQIECLASFDYEEWGDIVKGVTIFASQGIPLYNTSDNQKPSFIEETEICYNTISNITGDTITYNTRTAIEIMPHQTELFTDCYISPLNKRNIEDIADDIKSTSIFYKISELGRKRNDSNAWQKLFIKGGVLKNLTTQEQLTDDYYSHCPMSANYITTYNNRLLLAGVRRGFFEGFTSFMPYNQNGSYSAQEKILVIVVYIKTDEGTRIVSKRFTTSDIIGKYFFYPDPRAYRAKIYTVTASTTDTYNLIKDMELKEHPFLNGAYYFEGLPDGTETMEGGTPAETIDNDVKTPEYLYNQVFNSEANNPFVYRAEGNFTVGNGKVMALASLTQALSQGQFGQYPLIVFTDEGIYAASISNTGIVTAVHPMSRDVLNNVDSVTQTDGAIFFSSEKGLMVVVGNEVKCVSEQLNGKSSTPLQTYLKTAYIAYDYRDSLLWIFNGSEWCYIYSIKSGTFSRYAFDNVISAAINNYPDYLLQSGTKLYSLLNRPNINSPEEMGNSYTAHMVTRPMKLENAFALKKLIQIMHVHQMEGSLSLRIFASNNLKREASTWEELHSLLGTPWKYYKFQYDFTGLKATDRFAGTVVVTREERTDKLR